MAKSIDTERRLVAIFAADVEGYSRLMGADEVSTLRDLTERRAILDELIASHRGRIANTAGDSVLAEFGSAVDAVQCATEAQAALAGANATLSPERHIKFRIGIHVGDVMVKGGDLFGDGVNIAARLQVLASAGGTCISSVAYDQVRKILPLAFTDLGARQVKNIEEAVRAYAVTSKDAATADIASFAGAPGSNSALSLPDKSSIAVLPFHNMSGDPEQEYFADGIVEDIITGLSRIKWVSVIARNSSFFYRGKAIDLREVGRDLGVRYLLEGSVRKDGNTIRIGTQLIEAQNGLHLWAERYDRLLADIFALQDEITMSVIGAIEPNLRKAEIERVKRKRPDNLNAYDLVLRALPFVRTAMASGADAAIPLLNEALKLESDYAVAHALLAKCYHFRFSRGGLGESDRIMSTRHARAAVAGGPDDATTLAIAAMVIWFDDHDVDTAFRLFDLALTISNSNVVALSNSAFVLAWMGNTATAIERAQRAIQLSPFDTSNSHLALAVAHFHSRNYEKSRDAARCAVEANPTFSVPRVLLAASLIRLDQTDDAIVEARHVIELDPTFTTRNWSVTVGVAPDVFAPFADALCDAGIPRG